MTNPATAWSAPPGDDRAVWAAEGEDLVLRVRAGSVRAALSPMVVGVILVAGLLAGALTALADQNAMTVGGIALFTAASVGIVLYLARLHGTARTVELHFGADALWLIDGDTAPVETSYAEVSRILIAHDGAPARIRLTAAGRTRRWTIGQLHRNNTIAEFVAPLPDALVDRVRAAGLDGGTTLSRRIRITSFRRTAR